MRSPRLAAALALAILSATGCGGGGGDGGSISLDRTELTFQMTKGGAPPPAQEVRCTFAGAEVAAWGYAFVPSQPGWLADSYTGSGLIWTVRLSVLPGMAPGRYATTLRVGIGRDDGTIIATRDVAVTLLVEDVLTASPSALTFQHVVGAAVPAAQSVAVGGGGLAWTATGDQPWLHASPAAGQAPSTLSVTVDPAGLLAGHHEATLTLSRTGTAQTAAVAVSLDVAAPTVRATPASLSFSGVNGSAIAAQDVQVAVTSGEAAAWTAAANQPWIVLAQPPGATTPATLQVSVDPSKGPLASGAHTGTITLTATTADGPLTREVPVALALSRPVLTATPASVALGGPLGRDLASVPVELRLSSTPLASVTVTPTPSAAWIAPAAGTWAVGAGPVAIEVGPGALAGLAAGNHAGTLALSAQVNGDLLTATVDVALKLDTRRLLADDNGTAFASTPAGSRLTRTIGLREATGSLATWTAAADQPWLAVTASGVAPGSITLTANPLGLATDTLYEAAVTITPDDAGVSPETIRVGFWVGAGGQGSRTVAGSFAQVEVDPIRPYAYVHSGVVNVTVYNVYTGAVVRTFTHVAPTMGPMAAATDGSVLYVLDKTNAKVVPIDLVTGEPGTAFPVTTYSNLSWLAYARTAGKPLVFTGYNCGYDAATGAEVDGSPIYRQCSTMTAASVAGNRMCGAETESSPHSAYCHALDWTFADGRLVTGPKKSVGAEGYGGDVAVDPTGVRMYLGPGYHHVYAAETMTALQTFAFGPRNVEPLRDGRLLLANMGWYDTYDLYAVDADGFTIGSYRLAGYARAPLDRQVKATGEGLCVVAITDDPKLIFMTIGP